MLKRMLIAAGVLVTIVAVTVSAQTDISGTWNAIVELDLGSGEPTFVFSQDGDAIQALTKGRSAAPI